MHLEAMQLIDRRPERDELRELLEAEGERMALLYGRRRIGKTHLLRHAWSDDRRVLYFLASDTTPEFNRREFLETIVSRHSSRSIRPEDYPTWRTVFELIFDLHPDEPLVIVLDEFQYLLGGEDDVRSQLAAVWDRFDAERPLLLVLCGSAVRTMEELGGARAPLYGRLNWTHHLQPFDYWHAGAMAPFESPRARAVAYGVYGGTPRYLETLEGDADLQTNISRDVLRPNGEVRNLVETVVEQERGFQKIASYKAILTAVARGNTELGEIANVTGLTHDTALRRKVRKLEELGFVEGRRNFEAPSNAPYRYHLLDPALRFHHSVVTALQSALETTPPGAMWENHVAPRLSTHMGLVFERIVEQAYHRLRASRDLPVVSKWGRWEGLDHNRESLEMDVVARLADGRMMTGAVKWSSQPVPPTLHGRHLRDLQRLADSGKAWAHEALEEDALLLYVSAAGFEEGFEGATRTTEHRVLRWNLDDVYADEAAGPRNVS